MRDTPALTQCSLSDRCRLFGTLVASWTEVSCVLRTSPRGGLSADTNAEVGNGPTFLTSAKKSSRFFCTDREATSKILQPNQGIPRKPERYQASRYVPTRHGPSRSARTFVERGDRRQRAKNQILGVQFQCPSTRDGEREESQAASPVPWVNLEVVEPVGSPRRETKEPPTKAAPEGDRVACRIYESEALLHPLHQIGPPPVVVPIRPQPKPRPATVRLREQSGSRSDCSDTSNVGKLPHPPYEPADRPWCSRPRHVELPAETAPFSVCPLWHYRQAHPYSGAQ